MINILQDVLSLGFVPELQLISEMCGLDLSADRF